MPYLAIETGIEPRYETRLIESAKKFGWEIVKVNCNKGSWTFGDDYYDLSKGFMKRTDVWFHGDITSSQYAGVNTDWKVSTDWNALTYYNVLVHGGKDCLNDSPEWTTLDKLLNHPITYIKTSHFVRPNNVTKVFGGQIVSLATLNKDLGMLKAYEPPGSTVIVIAEAKKIITEARFVVIGNKLITGSVYQIDRQPIEVAVTSQQTLVAEHLLKVLLDKGFESSSPWTLDICQLHSGEWKIVEVGALSCSGLYLCDTGKIVEALNKFYFGG
jgi:hypothetical protein